MFLSAAEAGISLPAVIFGLVMPVAIFFFIYLLFKLLGVLIRFLRQKSLERAYRREERDKSEKN